MIALSQAGPMQCRFIKGEPKELLCCGKESVLGSSWCPKHFKVVHEKGSNRRLRTIPR